MSFLQRLFTLSCTARVAVTMALMLALGACHTPSDSNTDNDVVKQQEFTDLATDDLAYLTKLGLMRGHLYVGHELYKAGHLEHAKTHMKHPKSELYLTVSSAFETRGTNGFATQLAELSEAVEAEVSLDKVADIYQLLLSEINISEAAVAQPSYEPAQQFRLIANLLEVAAEEYAIAVVNGQMQNTHEYQDALGFTKVAKNILANLNSDNPAVVYAKQASEQQFASLESHWPSLIPPNSLSTRAATISNVARTIRKLASGLE